MRSLFRRRSSRARAILYSRDGCSLCSEAETHVRRVFGNGSVDVVDIIGDRELEDEYIFRIPVLVVGGQIVAEGRISMADVKAADAAARSVERAGERA